MSRVSCFELSWLKIYTKAQLKGDKIVAEAVAKEMKNMTIAQQLKCLDAARRMYTGVFYLLPTVNP
jgi:hypothetical protein